MEGVYPENDHDGASDALEPVMRFAVAAPETHFAQGKAEGARFSHSK